MNLVCAVDFICKSGHLDRNLQNFGVNSVKLSKLANQWPGRNQHLLRAPCALIIAVIDHTSFLRFYALQIHTLPWTFFSKFRHSQAPNT